MGNCCCIYVDDYPDICHQKIVRARKEHRCTECGATIAPGRLYERASMLMDGRWDTFTTCARCVNVRDEFFTCGYYFGGIREHFQECFGFDYARDEWPPDFAPCKGKEPTVEAA